jgi:hypothetical protein
MKPIQECYSDPHYNGDYDPMVSCFGAIVVSVADEDYQGDTRYLLRDGDRWGLLIVGWGSCSGCDALQACDTYKELEDLRSELSAKVEWFDAPTSCAERIRSRDWQAHCSWNAEKTPEFVAKACAALGVS